MRTRDAVAGDISLTKLEEYCVRTPTFQRLHRIKQLGNAFHVYPSAMHTRFEHSLGVCHQIRKLLEQPTFFEIEPQPDDSKKELLRLSGLLHDIVHTPFKHTLAHDVGIIPDTNLDQEYMYRFEEMDLEKKIGPVQTKELCKILSERDVWRLDEPYRRQLVEDTLSADLLDYSRRDAYFTTGATRQWDERIYDHIAVSKYASKPHLVARIADEKGNITESAITELLNLLYVRYILHERVYFYPTKIAADSLLVKSIRCLMQTTGIEAEEFHKATRNLSDEEFVNYLLDPKMPEASFYASRLKSRILPAMATQFKFKELPRELREKIARDCRGRDSLDKWLKYEEDIAKEAGIDKKNVIVYCHNLNMKSKKPDFLVKDDHDEPTPLEAHSRMKQETTDIMNRHENLWRCYVFCVIRDEEATLLKVKNAANSVLRN